MRVMLVAHVGETFGHLIRGLSIVKELSKFGCSIEIVSSPEAAEIIANSGLKCDFHPIRWDWSHNACEIDGLSAQFLNRILETIEDLLEVVGRCSPDFILGMPGFASTQVARHYKIPHASVIHGPHFAPIIKLENASETELYVLEMSKKVCLGPLNNAFQVLNRIFELPILDYKSYLESEMIFIPQPKLPFDKSANMFETSFVRGTIGPPFKGIPADLKDCCYITFGSGNPCDITRVILMTREIFPKVIVNVGRMKLGTFPDGITTAPFIASTNLAGHVSAVISHGGIGTVGTFAECGTPQLIIPTEFDQANMAIHASRAGIAKQVGLQSFVKRSQLGRRLVEFTDNELLAAIDAMRNQSVSANPEPSSGAEEIALKILSFSEEDKSIESSLQKSGAD
jgi:UDP:flavonoid glycosyltransferase YjiC (YdhE family)